MRARTTPAKISNVGEWVEEMNGLVARAADPLEQVMGALEIMERALAGAREWDLARFTPGRSSYARHLLHRDPADRFCLLCLVWKPGQGTPIHDHDHTWGVYGVLKNRMRFVNYHQDFENGAPSLKVISSTVAPEGAVTTVLPPHCDIHRMENPDGSNISLTLHCYGKEVNSFNIFQPETGARRLGSVSYDTVP